MKRTIFVFVVSLLTLGCKEVAEQTMDYTAENEKKEMTKGDVIINQAIEAHGGKLYSTAHYEFSFREKEYEFENNGSLYRYAVAFSKDGKTYQDEMSNGSMTRKINNIPVELSDKDQQRFSSSLNSVIYFATLPYKLEDSSVNKKFVGVGKVKAEDYNIVHITFEKEGGGEDHDDNYYYWINQKDNTIDYLAYDYTVNKGGVRFREAYNRRIVGGIIFQDYVNFKAPVGTALGDLPKMFENGLLKKLSLIETENVIQK